MINSHIYNGTVIHKRFKPKEHYFKYKVFSLLINLSELEKLDKMKSALQIQFKNLQVEESELVSSLNEKYGIGTVDINTGEFVPEN